MDNNEYVNYMEKIQQIANVSDNKYLFEMTKCCGYSFMMPVFKMNTFTEFYRIMYLELSHLTIQRIYLQNNNGEQLEIPNDETTICEFVNANSVWFTPVYPLPAKVVYRVFFDDGHIHDCT